MMAIPMLLVAQQPTVTDIFPDREIINADPNTSIELTFDVDIDMATVNMATFQIMGRWSGPSAGTREIVDGNTIKFTPDEPFFAGEMVMVNTTKYIAATGGGFVEHGYAFNFWIRTLPGGMDLLLVDVIEMRLENEGFIQCYGAYAGDINDDGYSDLTVVNEDAEDLRILLNDSTGFFGDFTLIDLPGSNKPSPIHAADFNHDGYIDVAVGSTQGPELSILMGDGTGLFGPETVYQSSGGVRGLTLLDMNCDGWADIVTANRLGDNVGFFMNEQDGTFADPYFMEAESNKETAAASADMNEDGIMDVVIGSYTGSEIIVLLNDGEGNFTIASSVTVNSNPWMIGVGDVNGDGHVDVVSANAGGSNMSVVMGNGLGQLGAPSYFSTGSFPLAIDLGDLDGDGDLDMISSNYSGVDYSLYENDGTGNFINPITYQAQGAGSCAIFHDRNNDGVMDITGIDEIADLVILWENSLVIEVGDVDKKLPIRAFPNPCEDVVYLVGVAGNSLVRVYDVSGRLLLEETTSNGQIDLSSIEERGMLVLSVGVDNHIEHLQVIKR